MTGSLAAGLSSGSVLILVALGLVIVHRFAVRPGYSCPRLATAAGTLLVAGSAGLLLSPGHLGLHPVAVAGDEVQLRQLVIPAVAFAAVVALFLVFRHTRFGLAMRAAASDREAALAQGVSARTVLVTSCALAAALYVLAGLMVEPDQRLWVVGLKTLPVLLLSGLMSLRLAVLGGLVVGLLGSLLHS